MSGLIERQVQVVLASQIGRTGTPVLSGTYPNQYWLTDNGAMLALRGSSTQLILEAVRAGNQSGSVVYVNGTFNQFASFAAFNTTQRGALTLTLPAGSNKLIQIVGGPYVTSIWDTSWIIQTPTNTKVLAIAGDSITFGTAAVPTNQLGWAYTYANVSSSFDNVINNGISGRSLFDIAETPTKRTTFIADQETRLKGTVSNTLLVALETNDFGLSKCSAVNYGVFLSALFTDVHAAHPDWNLMWFKALHRTGNGGAIISESTPNSFGDVLADYNTSGDAAIAGLGFPIAVISGFAAMTNSGLSADGLHPVGTALGHPTIATYMLGQIG